MKDNPHDNHLNDMIAGNALPDDEDMEAAEERFYSQVDEGMDQE